MQVIYNLMKTSVFVYTRGGQMYGSVPARFLSVLPKHPLLAPTSSRILGYLDLWSDQVLSFIRFYYTHFCLLLLLQPILPLCSLN